MSCRVIFPPRYCSSVSPYLAGGPRSRLIKRRGGAGWVGGRLVVVIQMSLWSRLVSFAVCCVALPLPQSRPCGGGGRGVGGGCLETVQQEDGRKGGLDVGEFETASCFIFFVSTYLSH